uniref:Uncharacterized protein n=1 Tax=Rhipicephalus pulchellus TaxID=72859 RepID=L7LYY7_RHIPC
MPDLRTLFPCCFVIVLNVSASEKRHTLLLKGGLPFWHRRRPKKACFGYYAVPLIARIFTTPVTYFISGLHCTSVGGRAVKAGNVGHGSCDVKRPNFRRVI